MRALLATLLGPLDRLLGRLMGGGFGLKDLFTLVNLVGGVASICLVILGELWWASFAIMLGYLGDVLDGPVARITGRQNRFGGELDNIADHTAQCVAPAFVVFLAYRELSLAVAFAAAALLVITGSIRHARGAAARFEFDLAWHGMPRPVAAFLVISFLNSNLFSQLSAGAYLGLALVLLVAVLNLVPLPFTNHHGRALQPWVVVSVVFFFASAVAVSLFWTRWFWDLVFLYVFVYATGSWVVMSRAERRAFFEASRRWRAELSGRRPAAPGDA